MDEALEPAFGLPLRHFSLPLRQSLSRLSTGSSENQPKSLALISEAKGDALAALAKAKAIAAAPTTDDSSQWPISDRIQDVRVSLSASTAIVDIASRLVDGGTDWCLHHALRVVADRIEAACMALGFLASQDMALTPYAPEIIMPTYGMDRRVRR